MASDKRLVKILDEAAKAHPDLYGAFRAHVVYGDSKTLRTILQALDQGAAIVRYNSTTYYFRIAPPLAGEWGEDFFKKLDKSQKEVVESVAGRIQASFTGET